jgi:hypothetical protein
MMLAHPAKLYVEPDGPEDTSDGQSNGERTPA